jgi:hypothetical protein
MNDFTIWIPMTKYIITKYQWKHWVFGLVFSIWVKIAKSQNELSYHLVITKLIILTNDKYYDLMVCWFGTYVAYIAFWVKCSQIFFSCETTVNVDTVTFKRWNFKQKMNM